MAIHVRERVDTGTGLGYFDAVRYDDINQQLTIVIRPSFNFQPFQPAAGTDPNLLAQLPLFLTNARAACKETFSRMAQCWGGWHKFVQAGPGAAQGFVTTQIEVEEVPAGPIPANLSYTPITFGNVGMRARVKAHNMVVDYTDGYVNMGGVIVAPIWPQEYIAAQLGLPPPNGFPNYTIMHELGHLFGLGDEYVAAAPGYAQGQPTDHSALAMRELGTHVFHGWNNKSIMTNAGGDILDVHGVSFLHALRTVSGVHWKFAGT